MGDTCVYLRASQAERPRQLGRLHFFRGPRTRITAADLGGSRCLAHIAAPTFDEQGDSGISWLRDTSASPSVTALVQHNSLRSHSKGLNVHRVPSLDSWPLPPRCLPLISAAIVLQGGGERAGGI